MGTEVLHPQHCFVHRFPLDPFAYQQRRRTYFDNRNVYGNPKPAAKITRPERLEKKNKWKKDSHSQHTLTIPKRSLSENELLHKLNNLHKNPPVETGRVKILRRGQSFDSFENNRTDGSDVHIYAGSAFSMSPPPDSLPLPSFFSNNKKTGYEDSASQDLRRLLGLKLYECS